MKKLLVLLCLLAGMQFAVAASEIQFEQSAFTEVLAKAKSENKLVFLDAYTSWCGPCKWMAKNAFTDPDVATYFNDHFVNLTVDMEKGEGVELAKQFAINAYPTLLFLDGTGKVVHVTVGARAAADLLQLGKDVVEGRALSIADLEKQFAEGERNPKFLHDYILALARAGKAYDAPLEAYMPSMRGDALLNEEAWEIFIMLFQRHDSEFATYFLLHRQAFEERYGHDLVQNKALSLYEYAVYQICESKDKSRLKQLKKEMILAEFDSIKTVLLQVDLQWFQTVEDWKHYAKTVEKLGDAGRNDTYNLNNAAWLFYEKVDNKRLLDVANEWITESVRLEKSSVNLDTQAMLLYKLGQKEAAIAAAKESIDMGKATGEDVSETEKALAEWQK
ncbi:MAG: thioredoxin family protein [Bacteroidia bacterium]|nr:thioredoxin family protein [Bacteroidia bacterium]